MKTTVLFLLLAVLSAKSQCVTCPSNAEEPALACGFGLNVVRDGKTNVLSSGVSVKTGEIILLRSNLRYNGIGSTGGVGAGYSGGSAHTFVEMRGTTIVHQHIEDVTPTGMDTTVICPGATQVKVMSDSTYTITSTDAAAGSLKFAFQYTNGLAALQNAQGNCTQYVSNTVYKTVTIQPSSPP